MQNFKKGSLVPRRLGAVLADNKGSQHYLVFGTDVVWDGKTLTSQRPMSWGEALIKVNPYMSAPRKNGTRQQSGFSMGLNWTLESTHDSETGVSSAKLVKDSK